MLSLLGQKFLTEPFLNELFFLFLEILASKQKGNTTFEGTVLSKTSVKAMITVNWAYVLIFLSQSAIILASWGFIHFLSYVLNITSYSNDLHFFLEMGFWMLKYRFQNRIEWNKYLFNPRILLSTGVFFPWRWHLPFHQLVDIRWRQISFWYEFFFNYSIE